MEICQLNILLKCPGCQKSIVLPKTGNIVRCEFCKMKQRRNNLMRSSCIKVNVKEIESGKILKKKVLFVPEIERHFSSLHQDYLPETQYFTIECLPNSDIINSI